MNTLKLTALFVGALCFLYTLMRNGFGAPAKRNAVDYIAMIGMWLFPVTWILYFVMMPVALLVDHFNAKESEARMNVQNLGYRIQKENWD